MSSASSSTTSASRPRFENAPCAKCKRSGVKLYEGCGKEGPIRSIFFAEFHPTQGPMIRTQVPTEVVSKGVFDVVSTYVIPKNELADRTITTTCLDFKVVGYPIYIADKKYPRNQFMFNACFVCYPWSRTVQFEAAVRKLSEFLADLERETLFLSEEASGEGALKLKSVLRQVFHDLNTHDESKIEVHGLVCPLKLVRTRPDPPKVLDWSVPMFLFGDPDEFKVKDFIDLTISQILPYIDGYRHVAAIAKKARVGRDLVKMAVQNLAYYGIVALVPVFQMRNTYRATTDFINLKEDPTLTKKALAVANQGIENESERLNFAKMYRFACDYRHGTTMQDLVVRNRALGEAFRQNIPEFTQFLCFNGIIQRIHRYPKYREKEESASLPSTTHVTDSNGSVVCLRSDLRTLFNGKKCYDEICCLTGLSAKDLDKVIEEEPDVIVFSR